MNHNLRYHHLGSPFWAVVLVSTLLSVLPAFWLAIFLMEGAADEEGDRGVLFFLWALCAIIGLWLCIRHSWPCFDYKKRVVRRFLGVVKIDEVSDMTRDYHVSFDKNGNASETFTVRLLGRFGSKDIRFNNRRTRDEFEYVLQAARNGESVGNTNISPDTRFIINIILTLVTFCVTSAAVLVWLYEIKDIGSLRVALHDKLSAGSSEQNDAAGANESNPDDDIKVSRVTESATKEALLERKEHKDGQSGIEAGTSKNMTSPRSNAQLEPKPDDSVQKPNAAKFNSLEGTSKSADISAAVGAHSPSENMAIARSNEPPAATQPNSEAAQLHLKIAELQGELAVINAKIETERKRWQDANTAINALTNNKTAPVVRNSPQHVQMYQAQVIMKEVEAGAPSLKEEKGRLEATIKSLQDSISSK
ncbi:hypothetical protein [Prosthecobacter sp.]